MYRPSSALIIGLCTIILGMSFVTLWFINSRLPAVHSTSAKTLQTVAACPPVVEDTRVEAQRAVIAQLEADVRRLQASPIEDAAVWQTKAKQLEQDLTVLRAQASPIEDAVVWRTKAEQLERDLTMLQQDVERALATDWQQGKLLLAHTLIKERRVGQGDEIVQGSFRRGIKAD